jgi:DNA repair protein RadC
MSEHLKKITDLAKKLRKAKPSLKWIDAVKTAAKNIAKLPATKKKIISKIVKKDNKKNIKGWVKGQTHIIEHNEKKVGNFKTVKVHRAPKNSLLKPGTFNYFQPLTGIKYPTRSEIILTGISKASTLQKLVPEVKVKVLRGKFAPTDIIKSITDSVDVLRKFFTKNKIETQEYFAVMFLNQQNKVLGIYINSMGTMNSATVDVRLVMSAALQIGALGMILCHNHPSGNLTPSEADLQLTKGLKKACDQLSINLLDHVILTKNGFYSFLNAGKL